MKDKKKTKNKLHSWYHEDNTDIIDLLGKISLKHGDTFRVIQDIPLDIDIENTSIGDLPTGSLISFERIDFRSIYQPATLKYIRKRFCLFRVAHDNLCYYQIYKEEHLTDKYLEKLDTKLIFEEIPILTNETISSEGVYTNFSDFINQLDTIQKETLDKFKYEYLKISISGDYDYCDRDDCCGSHGIKTSLYGARLETNEEATNRINKELIRKEKSKVYRNKIKDNKKQ